MSWSRCHAGLYGESFVEVGCRLTIQLILGSILPFRSAWFEYFKQGTMGHLSTSRPGMRSGVAMAGSKNKQEE